MLSDPPADGGAGCATGSNSGSGSGSGCGAGAGAGCGAGSGCGAGTGSGGTSATCSIGVPDSPLPVFVPSARGGQLVLVDAFQPHPELLVASE